MDTPAEQFIAYDAKDLLTFYEGVRPLANELARTLCIALDQGHAGVCVVTDSTRRFFEKQLTKRGIDVAAARDRGQYIHLDAADVLSRISLAGAPDPLLFEEVIGARVARLEQEYSRIWMYGELTSLMWFAGNRRGALALDKLWTAIGDTHPVCLCVAFPVEALSDPLIVEAIHEVVADQIRILAKGCPLGLVVRHGPQADAPQRMGVERRKRPFTA